MMKNTGRLKVPVFTIIILISLGGGYLIWYSTYWGPVVFSDATGYIRSAQNLVDGHGIGMFTASGRFGTLGHFGPLYPLVLSVFGFVGFDLVVAARWINIVLFALSILLIGVAFFLITRSPWFSIAASFLLLISPDVIARYLPAMSEPLFLVTGFTGIFLLLLYFERGNLSILTSASIAGGLSFLTRYLGAAFIVAGVFGLLVLRRRAIKSRILEGGYFAILSSIPMIIWRIWLLIQPHAYLSQQIRFNPGNIWTRLIPLRTSLINNFWSWYHLDQLLPFRYYRFKLNFLIFAVVLFGIAVVLALRKIHDHGEQEWFTHRCFRLIGLLVFFIVAYVGILAFSFLFAYPEPNLGQRIISPIPFTTLIIVFSIFYLFTKAWPSKSLPRILPIAGMLMISAVWLPTTYEMVSDHHQNGSGFTSVYWRSSGTIEALLDLPQDIPVITNEPAAVLFLTERPAYEIAELSRDTPLPTYTRYGDEINDNVQRIFREEGGALVLFDTIRWDFWPLYEDETSLRLEAFTQDLSIHSESWDGEIYFYKQFE